MSGSPLSSKSASNFKNLFSTISRPVSKATSNLARLKTRSSLVYGFRQYTEFVSHVYYAEFLFAHVLHLPRFLISCGLKSKQQGPTSIQTSRCTGTSFFLASTTSTKCRQEKAGRGPSRSGSAGFYVTRVSTDEQSGRFLLSTSMSSSDTFRASRLVVFPPRVLKRDLTDLFQTLKNLRAVFSRFSPDSPLLHSVLGKVRTTEHPFSERTRRSSSMAAAEPPLRL